MAALRFEVPQAGPGSQLVNRWVPGQGFRAQVAPQNTVTGGAGAGGGALQNLYQEMQSARESANRANEERYQAILSGLEGMGATESADISDRFRDVAGRGLQHLAASGLYGSSLAPSVMTQAARGESREQGALQERLRRERFGFMERREDTAPDLGLLAQIASQLDAGSGAGMSGLSGIGLPAGVGGGGGAGPGVPQAGQNFGVQLRQPQALPAARPAGTPTQATGGSWLDVANAAQRQSSAYLGSQDLGIAGPPSASSIPSPMEAFGLPDEQRRQSHMDWIRQRLAGS